ncbi:MAG: UDP-3-O-(3-hydroxymyristoyl)glucosamine N-acyltransferase [Lentisphaeria bacterium]|jgi:UDP-3-O-[3-hydroxymyristoyl] glucosamine N-acyltransferase
MYVEKTCEEIAALVRGRLSGSCRQTLSGVASLKEAMPSDVAFLGNEKYREQVLPSRAGVVLVPETYDVAPPDGRAWIFCADPSQAFSILVSLFTPPPVSYEPGIHPSAIIADDAVVATSAHVGPCAVIGAKAQIGEHCVIGPGCVIGQESSIGEHSLLYARVVIRERCIIGKRVIMHPGVVIGADGFGYNSTPQGHEKVPQVGIVQIDDDVEIGANSCVDRARFGRTWIQQGTKIDNLVQIGHNVQIGAGCLIVSQAGISGSSTLGRGVILAGQVGVAGHLTLGDGAIVMAQSGISKDLAPGAVVFGTPAMDRRDYAKQSMYIGRLDKTAASIKELTREIGELKAKLASLEEKK